MKRTVQLEKAAETVSNSSMKCPRIYQLPPREHEKERFLIKFEGIGTQTKHIIRLLIPNIGNFF